MHKANFQKSLNQKTGASTQTKSPSSEIATWVEDISFVVPIPKKKNEPWNWAFWTGRIRKIFNAKDKQAFHKMLKEVKEFPVSKRGAILNNKIKDEGY